MNQKDSKSAYVVPIILWDRIMNELQELKNKHQSGGGIVGMNSKGDLNTHDLLKNLAIQQTIQQNPKSSVIGLLDQWTRETLNDPNLSSSEKIHLIGSLNRAQHEQLKSAKSAAGPAPTPTTKSKSPTPSPASTPSSSTTSVTEARSKPPPYESVWNDLELVYDNIIQKEAKKIQKMEKEPMTPAIKQSIKESEKKIQEYHTRKASLRNRPKPKKLFTPT